MKKPVFVDRTAEAGLARISASFSAVFADIDNDGDDDLIVCNHGWDRPSIYLNKGGLFVESPNLIPTDRLLDRHGVTAVDIDNDGDRDLIIAAGSADGLRDGAKNEFFLNLLQETGELRFEDASERAGITFRSWRGRSFLPTSSLDGKWIDLYFTCKRREGNPNIYLGNRGNLTFVEARRLGLNQSFSSEGKDIFFDFDRDGDRDLLLIDKERIKLFERRRGKFVQVESGLEARWPVETVAVGDLNNDGFPDLFIGFRTPYAFSDNVFNDQKQINIRLVNSFAGDRDEIVFRTASDYIAIDFDPKPGLPDPQGENVFIGGSKNRVFSMVATITAASALGEPEIDESGVYIWYDPSQLEWHIVIKYSEGVREFRGEILAINISDLRREDFEINETNTRKDRIFINEGGEKFTILPEVAFEHDLTTRSAQILDVDSDGFADIVGIRGSEPGRRNGNLFFIMNLGERGFKFVDGSKFIPSESDTAQADILIYGFADGDGYPDLFMTNGWGIRPGNRGPYHLLLNRAVSNNFLVVELTGTVSNRDAIGAQVELRTRRGRLLGYRELGVGYNRAQNTHKLHFGLGRQKGPLWISIRWPSGTVQRLKTRINRVRLVREPAASE